MAAEEAHVVSALVNLCKELNIRCIVQVGAEDGYEAWCIRQAIPACRAVAIDADPQVAPHRDIEHYQSLIGTSDADIAPFYLYTSGLSSQVPRGEDDKPVSMQMWRLDTFCIGIAAAPDALLIDTEGTTMDVLVGARDILDGVRLIYAECSDGQIRPGGNSDIKDVRAFLEIRGFAERKGLPAYNAGGQANYTFERVHASLAG